MSKQENQTDKPSESSSQETECTERRSYYYDDSTGYEIYDPAKDDEDETEENDE